MATRRVPIGERGAARRVANSVFTFSREASSWACFRSWSSRSSLNRCSSFFMRSSRAANFCVTTSFSSFSLLSAFNVLCCVSVSTSEFFCRKVIFLCRAFTFDLVTRSMYCVRASSSSSSRSITFSQRFCRSRSSAVLNTLNSSRRVADSCLRLAYMAASWRCFSGSVSGSDSDSARAVSAAEVMAVCCASRCLIRLRRSSFSFWSCSSEPLPACGSPTTPALPPLPSVPCSAEPVPPLRGGIEEERLESSPSARSSSPSSDSTEEVCR
mmetsp:Transcript_29487/g.74192  ORF Transcript_29487/g.74192 Transcript_29487/m.74192 type:complete len:269 (+) Transcript_29487:219-1025(+)